MIVELENGQVKACPLCADESFLHTNADGSASLQKYSRQLFWIKCNNLQCGCTLNSAEDQRVVLDRWNKRW